MTKNIFTRKRIVNIFFSNCSLSIYLPYLPHLHPFVRYQPLTSSKTAFILTLSSLILPPSSLLYYAISSSNKGAASDGVVS
jgi:hypothetical protein